jgi:hypothetical protein
MNYQGILEQIHQDLQPYLGTGRVADYIPELANVPANSFGMAIVRIFGPHTTNQFSATCHLIRSSLDGGSVCPASLATSFTRPIRQ